jgi:hypothetical protein
MSASDWYQPFGQHLTPLVSDEAQGSLFFSSTVPLSRKPVRTSPLIP